MYFLSVDVDKSFSCVKDFYVMLIHHKIFWRTAWSIAFKPTPVVIMILGRCLWTILYLASSAGMSDVITGHCCTPLCSFVMWDRATCSNTGPLLCQISMKCGIYLKYFSWFRPHLIVVSIYFLIIFLFCFGFVPKPISNEETLTLRFRSQNIKVSMKWHF